MYIQSILPSTIITLLVNDHDLLSHVMGKEDNCNVGSGEEPKFHLLKEHQGAFITLTKGTGTITKHKNAQQLSGAMLGDQGR